MTAMEQQRLLHLGYRLCYLLEVVKEQAEAFAKECHGKDLAASASVLQAAGTLRLATYQIEESVKWLQGAEPEVGK